MGYRRTYPVALTHAEMLHLEERFRMRGFLEAIDMSIREKLQQALSNLNKENSRLAGGQGGTFDSDQQEE